MGSLAAVFLMPLAAYCLVQLIRDACRRQWMMTGWGAIMLAFIVWIIERLTAGPQY